MHTASALRVFFVLIGWLMVTVLGTAQSMYKETAVSNGGTIRGVVRAAPGTKNADVLAVHKDDKICGRQKPSPRLQLGKNGGVANAVIFIEGIQEGKRFAAHGKYVLDQKGCEYVPHISILPFGATLEIMNSDPLLHNVHAYDHELGKTLFNIAQPIKGQRTPIKHTTFKKPGVYLATCDAGHPWMSAYIMVTAHPYYVKTGNDGSFSLDDVPPGVYTLTMWHEGVNITKTLDDGGKPKAYIFEPPYVLSQQVIVPERGNVAADFELVVRKLSPSPLPSAGIPQE